MRIVTFLFLACFLICCESIDEREESFVLKSFLESESIEGKPEYLSSPYVTAGHRLYMVGHQDGSFPELGWHIKNEMGGIWNHPIKLMDGFELEMIEDDHSFKFQKANKFINHPFGNRHIYTFEDKQLEVNRIQFVPDTLQGILIHYVFKNTSSKKRNLELVFTGHSDLRPTWLSDSLGVTDALDEARYNAEDNSILVKDKENPWYVKFGSTDKAKSFKKANSNYGGKGVSRALKYSMTIPAGSQRDISFFIAGSYQSEEEVTTNYDALSSKYSDYLQAKKARYEELAENSKLTLQDKDLERSFRWLKYNCDWLVQSVPEIGSGIMAGIPDYPWWFGVDSEYALRGYVRIGQHDAVFNTIRLLDSMSEVTNGNGRIIHEMSTNGVVFNKGNINETPQFASLIWDIYKWTGDKEFLERYYTTIVKGLNWLYKENDIDNNLFPDGAGMMEIHGLESEMIDVAAYTQKAFLDASKIAEELGYTSSSLKYLEKAQQLKEKINREFWSEEHESYADFISNDKDALKLIDDAIVRADTLNKPWAVEELTLLKENLLSKPSRNTRPFVMHHNWVVNTPMEVEIADSLQAIRALKTAEKFVNPFGVFVTGIDRDETAGSDEGSFKGSKSFSYVGAVMTLPTAVQIIAENNYGRPDNALNYLKRMDRSFSFAFPGSMYEVSPDYGMITQAWNIYGYAVPIISQFFGIDPMVSDKTIYITPNMPSTWTDVAIENVKIGSNEISIFYEATETKLNVKILQTDISYKLILTLPKGKSIETYDEVKINEIDKSNIEFTTELMSTEIIIHYE